LTRIAFRATPISSAFIPAPASTMAFSIGSRFRHLKCRKNVALQAKLRRGRTYPYRRNTQNEFFESFNGNLRECRSGCCRAFLHPRKNDRRNPEKPMLLKGGGHADNDVTGEVAGWAVQCFAPRTFSCARSSAGDKGDGIAAR
jgi:hypothetical protein